jgi:hypothetical protein
MVVTGNSDHDWRGWVVSIALREENRAMVALSPGRGRHEPRRASTEGRFGCLRRTGNRPSVGDVLVNPAPAARASLADDRYSDELADRVLILVSVQAETIYPWPGGQASKALAVGRKPG